jgi:hypothetical protein
VELRAGVEIVALTRPTVFATSIRADPSHPRTANALAQTSLRLP